MRSVRRHHWRALVHGMALGRLAYPTRGRLADVDLSHLRGENAWLRQRNIVGICIARKKTGGELGELCLQVLVRRKRAKSKVAPAHRIPETIDARPVLPIRKLPTDVRAVGSFSPDTLISGARPAQPGFAVGGKYAGIGTIGCAVRDANGRLLGLSCAHVVSDNGHAAPGVEVLVPPLVEANAIGVAEPEFGTLVQTGSICFTDAATASNLDAATFLPDDPSWLNREIALLGRPPSGVLASVSDGQAVVKVGATTERTTGTVIASHLAVKVPYVAGNAIKVATFLDQIDISPFTDSGDSCSLVVTDDYRAVGLHFASAAGMSVCTPIQTVLDRLGVTLA